MLAWTIYISFIGVLVLMLLPREAARAARIIALLTAIAGCAGCLLARMSGSGATCFGLFGGEDAARVAAADLTAARPDWWVTASAVLSRAPAPRRLDSGAMADQGEVA